MSIEIGHNFELGRMPRVQWLNIVPQIYKGQGLQSNDPTNNIYVGQDGMGLENTFAGQNQDPILVRTSGLEWNGIWSWVLSHTLYNGSILAFWSTFSFSP